MRDVGSALHLSLTHCAWNQKKWLALPPRSCSTNPSSKKPCPPHPFSTFSHGFVECRSALEWFSWLVCGHNQPPKNAPAGAQTGVCGVVWKTGDTVYHCRTCGMVRLHCPAHDNLPNTHPPIRPTAPTARVSAPHASRQHAHTPAHPPPIPPFPPKRTHTPHFHTSTFRLLKTFTRTHMTTLSRSL